MTTLNELRSQADEIDRLRTEAVAAAIEAGNLVAGDSVLVIAGLTAERDALKAERADLLSLALQAKRHHDKVVAELEMSKMKTYAASISPIAKERDELRAALAERDAKLTALEGQEPVAVVGSGYALYWQGSEPLSKLLERFDTVKVGSFLYAAAGAAPKEPT